MVSNNQKWMITLWSAIVFILIANPFTFKLTNMLTSLVGLHTVDYKGCPTVFGFILHTVVFALIIRGMMGKDVPGIEN